jgi:transcription elongation factor Elf1
MTEWSSFTDAELDSIANQVWGEGRYTPGIGSINGVCPKCGATTRVVADETIGRRPQMFRATCTTCETRGSGRASKHETRHLKPDEIETIVRRHHQNGLASHCPVCQAPLQIRKVEISGSSGDHFMIKCLRCGSHGQMGWPPQPEVQ